jgi:hypothetical protein
VEEEEGEEGESGFLPEKWIEAKEKVKELRDRDREIMNAVESICFPNWDSLFSQ